MKLLPHLKVPIFPREFLQDFQTTAMDTAHEDDDANDVWSEICIFSECYNAMALHDGKIVLVSKGQVVGSISNLRIGRITAFFQQPIDILHRAFHNMFYLWIVYEEFLDLVCCDAKNGYEMSALKTLSFFRPLHLGLISKFDVLDSGNGKGSRDVLSFVCALISLCCINRFTGRRRVRVK